MEWIKQNVVLVVSLAVAVVLIGAAGWYFYSKISSEQEINQQLAAAQQTLTDLQSKIPFPNQENFEKVLIQQKQLLEFRAHAERFYQPIQIPAGIRNTDFNSHLLGAFDELQREAVDAKVGLPTNFAFGFTAQRDQLQFDTNTLPLVAAQLADIKQICQLLYKAKVYDILGFRRTAISPADKSAKESQQNLQDYLHSSRTITTNDTTKAVIFPYEASFKGSSAEVAAALTEMAQSSNGYIVKAVTVSPFEAEGVQEGTTEVAATPTYRGMSASMMMRYGLMGRGRYAPPPPQAMGSPTAAPTTRVGTILKEKPLKVALLIYAVKLQPIKP